MKKNPLNTLLFNAVLLLSYSPLDAMQGGWQFVGFDQKEIIKGSSKGAEKKYEILYCPFRACHRSMESFAGSKSLVNHLAAQHFVCPYCEGLDPLGNAQRFEDHCKQMADDNHKRHYCADCRKYVISIYSHQYRGCHSQAGNRREIMVSPDDVIIDSNWSCPFGTCKRHQEPCANYGSFYRHLLRMHNSCPRCCFNKDQQPPQYSTRRDLIRHLNICTFKGDTIFYCEDCFNNNDCGDDEIPLTLHEASLVRHQALCQNKQKNVPDINNSRAGQLFTVPKCSEKSLSELHQVYRTTMCDVVFGTALSQPQAFELSGHEFQCDTCLKIFAYEDELESHLYSEVCFGQGF